MEEVANQSAEAIATTETPAIETIDTPVEPFLEIKYNKESIKLDKEKAAEYAQKGMNYDKAIERAKQESRDAYIAEQGYTWQDKPITTEAEYKQAVKDQEMYESLKKKELPDDVIQEMVENRKFREETKTKETEAQKKAKVESDFKEFIEAYPDVKDTDIPKAVWDEVKNGKSLVDAYAKHENQTLKQKLAEATKQKQIEQLNEENKVLSTGSVVGQGTAIVTNFTREQVAAMSKEEMKVNYKDVVASMKTWKKL